MIVSKIITLGFLIDNFTSLVNDKIIAQKQAVFFANSNVICLIEKIYSEFHYAGFFSKIQK